MKHYKNCKTTDRWYVLYVQGDSVLSPANTLDEETTFLRSARMCQLNYLTLSLTLQVQEDTSRSFCWTYQPLNTKALFPFETSVYVKLTAIQCNITEDQTFRSQIILKLSKERHQEMCKGMHPFMDHNRSTRFPVR